MRVLRFLAGGALLLGAAVFMAPAEAADRQVYIRAVPGPEGRFEAAPGSSGATINQGDTVYWANQDESTHNATGQGWGTGNIPPGGEASETFNTPGTFNYSCTIHPSMTGTLQVNAVSTPPPPPPPPPVTAAPMQPAPNTTRAATATTARSTATTARGATTTTGGFDLLATTTTLEATTTTAQQLAISEEDDDGGTSASTVAAAVLAPLVLLGGGGYLLYRLRARP